MKILITDCLLRKSFDIFNIVKRYYNIKDIILTAKIHDQRKAYYIYKTKTFLLRKDDKKLFVTDLLSISSKYKNENIIYLPIEEDTTLLFYFFIEKYGNRNFLFLLPRREIFNLSRDKYLLNKYCLNNAIPAPLLFEFSHLDKYDNNEGPFIIKPRHGSGASNIMFADNVDELKHLEIKNPQDYVIQEKIANGKNVVGAFLLCKDGNIITSYCHRRIRTYPIDGGVSVYSKIIENKDVIKISAQLLRKLEWSGFAMLEFLWDNTDKTYKLIEINPRLWGSILLSEFSNTLFLKNYINLSLNQNIVPATINWNTKIRWIPFDLVNFFKSKGKIKDFWKLNKQNTCYINWTYANKCSALLFHLFFYLNLNNFKKFIVKWKK